MKQMQQLSLQFKRKRKMLLALPVLVLPFMTLLFWSLGGGKATASNTGATAYNGLNMSLPDAKLSNTNTDKLSLYQQALKDSAKREQQRKEDPYGSLAAGSLQSDTGVFAATTPYVVNPVVNPASGNYYGHQDADANEQKVQQRLGELRRNLAQPDTKKEQDFSSTSHDGNEDLQMNRLTATMQNLQQINASGNSAGDPDLEKMNQMLQKIYDIQHPDAVKEKLQSESEKHKGTVYSVNKPKTSNTADLLQPLAAYKDSSMPVIAKNQQAAFYESGSIGDNNSSANKAISAVVHETQTLVSGATAKLRLMESIYVNGTEIPKGTFLSGTCDLQGERMRISIKTIRYLDMLFPVSLTVYSLDGLPGISIPDAITRDAVKQGMNEGTQSMDILSMNQSLGAQAAEAGVQATKALLSKKIKLVRATVKAGYPVLLLDDNKKKNNN